MEGLAMGQEFNPPLRYHIIPLNDLREHENTVAMTNQLN